MAEQETLLFFKKNVPYPVGVRFYVGDRKGKTLTDNDPYVSIKESEYRDFKRANRIHLQEGLLVKTVEPDFDEESPNAITDEQAEEIVKNQVALSKTLKAVTSEVAVLKLLEEAKFQQRNQKTIDMINKRLREIVGETPDDMKGVEWQPQGDVKFQ